MGYKYSFKNIKPITIKLMEPHCWKSFWNYLYLRMYFHAKLRNLHHEKCIFNLFRFFYKIFFSLTLNCSRDLPHNFDTASFIIMYIASLSSTTLSLRKDTVFKNFWVAETECVVTSTITNMFLVALHWTYIVYGIT